MPAKNPVRRAQLISTFGIGGMVDFPRDQSYMIAGLDAWPYATEPCPSQWHVVEERLQARLGVKHLRLPPEYKDPGPGVKLPEQRIPAVRFPRWHYCPRPACGCMTYVSIYESSWVRCPSYGGSPCTKKGVKGRPFVIPARFVAACSRGHIQDFPFMEWVHEGRDPGPDHELRYVPKGSSASLSGIRIRCSCGSSRTMAGAFNFDDDKGGAIGAMGYDCRGDRPWLGETDGSGRNCGAPLRTLQRGASNIYFPLTVSSIYLPLWAEREDPEIVRTLENPAVWERLTSGLEEGRYIQRERSETIAVLRELDPDAFHEAAQRRLDGVPDVTGKDQDVEQEYRRAEFDAFVEGRGDPDSDLYVEVRNAEEYDTEVMTALRRVCLVRKLRETRALAGFTRILPANGPRDERLQKLSVEDLHWLPATIVRGEGILLEFDPEPLNEWQKIPSVATRIDDLSTRMNQKRTARGLEPREVTPKFVLLHTLAHVLIEQLSFECGYGSASLRERIYCELDSKAEPMQGILVYTASGDSEGTLGGLVRQGESGRLEKTFLEGLRRASWCSSDPVCIESTGQGTDNANLAACHGCVLTSETSCEEGNRLLDRALLVGELDEDRDSGFFSDVIHEMMVVG